MVIKMNNHYDFLVESNLGKLARHLRFYGVSVYYDAKSNHRDLVEQALKQNITLITAVKTKKRKDKPLLSIPAQYRGSLEKQLIFLINNPKIRSKIDLNKSRCGLCNTRLELVLKDRNEDYKEILPEKSYNYFKANNFTPKIWICKKCLKYYWEGSHWEKILRKIQI